MHSVEIFGTEFAKWSVHTTLGSEWQLQTGFLDRVYKQNPHDSIFRFNVIPVFVSISDVLFGESTSSKESVILRIYSFHRLNTTSRHTYRRLQDSHSRDTCRSAGCSFASYQPVMVVLKIGRHYDRGLVIAMHCLGKKDQHEHVDGRDCSVSSSSKERSPASGLIFSYFCFSDFL